MSESTNGFRKRGVDYDVSEPMPTLPREFYHSEAVFEEELEKIFGRRWFLACREEEVAALGDFITVPVGEESILVVRDEGGRIWAHFNVCRHRGTRLCAEERGRFETGFIRCPYHAWQYRLDGRLKAAPLMADAPGFRREDHPLYAAHVALWGGFVFLNLAEHHEPFEVELGALAGRFEAWRLPQLRIAHAINYSLACNWKLVLQNYQECYHCPGVHPLLSERTPFRSAVHDCLEGPVIGGHMQLAEPGGSMTMDGKAAAPPVCDVAGEDLRRVHYYSVFPNLLLSPHPDFVLYHRLRPEGHGRTRVDCFFLLHPDVIADRRAMDRFQSAVRFWDLTNRQDWEVCEQMQLGLASRRFAGGRYGPQEDMLFAIDREVLRALGRGAVSSVQTSNDSS